MRKTKIGVMDFHGSVDITDPCYDKDVWCRMNNVKISEGEYPNSIGNRRCACSGDISIRIST